MYVLILPNKHQSINLREISYVECGFSSIKIHYSVNRIMKFMCCFFSKKYRQSDILLKNPKLHL